MLKGKAAEQYLMTDKLRAFQSFFLPTLENFFLAQQTNTELIGSFAKEMLDKLNEFTLRGGKKVRPALLYYVYQDFSGSDAERVLPIAIACELMQSFLLILDDIMDEAELRRGGKTMHHVFLNAESNWRYAESIAMLVGSIAGYLGIQAINETDFEPELKSSIMDLYAKTCVEVGYGQALDLLPVTLHNFSESEIYNLYYYKTASYTTEFPLLCAGILTKRDEKTLTILKELAKCIGVLFQMHDDVLGLFSASTLIGKSELSDVQQGKKTLLISKAWKEANPEQREILSALYGKKEATLEEAVMIRSIVVNTGAFEYMQAMMRTRAIRAGELLNNLNWSGTGRSLLEDLINYCMHINIDNLDDLTLKKKDVMMPDLKQNTTAYKCPYAYPEEGLQ